MLGVVKVFHESDLSALNRFLRSKGLPDFKVPEKITYTDPKSGKKRKPYGIDEQWFLPRSDVAEKKMFYIIQRFDTRGYGRRVRVGYYKIGTKGKFKDKWAWGQFCPSYTIRDLTKLVPLLKQTLSG